MILAKLTDFALRMGLGDQILAPIYVEKGVRIASNGTVRKIEDCPKGTSHLLPREVLRSSNIASQLLWDKCSYMFGVVPEGKHGSKLEEKHEAFLKKHEELLSLAPDHVRLQAVVAFAKKKHSLKHEFTEGNYALFFEDDALPIGALPELRKILDDFALKNASGTLGTCPVTGGVDVLMSDNHAKVKPLAGSNSAGGSVISFNVRSSWSWGYEGNDNFPVGSQVFFGYTTALSWLLSNRRVQVASKCTAVWWASEAHALEDLLEDVLRGTDQDPSAVLKALDEMVVPDGEMTFAFITGAQGRAQITEWFTASLETVRISLRRYVEVFTVRGFENTFCPGFKFLLKSSTRVDSKGDGLGNVRPFVAMETFKAVVSNTRFPRLLIQSTIRELQRQLLSEEVSRALNPTRLHILSMSLLGVSGMLLGYDPDRRDPPYLLGNLFAVMEEIQRRAITSLRKSGVAALSDRFLGEASQRPARIFPHLQRLSRHHQTKMTRKRMPYYRYLEDLYLAIQEKLQGTMPLRLLWEEQSVFLLGYDHMRSAIRNHIRETRKDAEAARSAQNTPT